MKFEWGSRTFIMGIINCSPDSFSGDGLASAEAAVTQGEQMVEEGADILDLGGASTRPGATWVDADEEVRRVLPVIQTLAKRVNVPLSIDTSRARVARAALDAGARIVNDVWALTRDAELPRVVADTGAYVVLMHNRDAPARVGALGGHYGEVQYDNPDLVAAVADELVERVEHAGRAGIGRERIIIDPGVGFGKGLEQNLELLRRLREFKQHPALGSLPLLIGTSRKSVIGLTLNLPPGERLEGTLATLALAVAQGVDIVRAHDVRAAVRACRMADAIVRGAQT